MATPRKYPTLSEFTELKAAVDRIEQKLNRSTNRPSVYVDPIEIGDRLGVIDADGCHVTVGDWIRPIDGLSTCKVTSIALNLSEKRDGDVAVVIIGTSDGQTVTTVDMRLLNHVVDNNRKATT